MSNDNWLFGDEIVEFQQWRPQRAHLGFGWRSIADRLLDTWNAPQADTGAAPTDAVPSKSEQG